MPRFDNVGFFWEDKPALRGEKRDRVMPAIPETGWRPPREYPNLSSARVLSIDCETYDPELEDNGPGWARGKGHIVGASVAVEGGKWYFPIRHEIEPEYNLNPEITLRWLNDMLRGSQPKVGANLTYDVGWLRQEGVHVGGQLIDIQFAEALLNERSKVALEIMAQKYLGEGKESNLLYQWCADFYGGNPTPDQRKHIYKTPPRLAGPYAESDADLPLRIAPLLYPLLAKENLTHLFEMECGLIRLMIDMRFKGVRVDIAKAEELRNVLEKKETEEQEKLNNLVGFRVATTESESIARAFDSLGLKYNRTAKSNQPSFTKKFLQDTKNPVTDLINEIRKLQKLRGTFIESYVLGSHVNGRLHGQFHLLRSDEGGTRSGRWSSSTPNLQNIPSRDEILAPLIRGLFLPDYGHKQWRKYDYSQIEYRFLIHYAIGPGSDEARAKFNSDPDTDYHDFTQSMIGPYAGWDMSTEELWKKWRRPVKNINFGLIFGMGEDKLAGDLNLTKKEGKTLFAAYHKAVPFARATMKEAMEEVQRTGVMTTILGRKSYFDLWEPKGWGTEGIALPYEQAILAYGDIERAFGHKALNRKLQGSAADLFKKAMYNCYNAGIFDYTGVPELVVHDEGDFSDPGGVDEAYDEMRHMLETAIPLRIPVRSDCEVGPDWGHTK